MAIKKKQFESLADELNSPMYREQFNRFVKAREAAMKMAQVRKNNPIKLTYDDIQALEEYLPELKELIKISVW